jgi:hypothetical protein
MGDGGFRSTAFSGYSISVLFLGNISVPQKNTEIWDDGGWVGMGGTTIL